MVSFGPAAQREACREWAEPGLANEAALAEAGTNWEIAALGHVSLLEWSRYHPVATALGGLVVVGEVAVAWALAGWLDRRWRRWRGR